MGEGTLPSSGVQALITRLRSQGIESGRQEAARILDAARAEAAALVAAAHSESDAIRSEAADATARETAAARAALDLACRDALIQLREQIEVGMKERLAEVVAAAIQPPDHLAVLLIEIVRQQFSGRDTPVQGRLVVGVDAGGPSLDALVAALARDVLTHGIEVRRAATASRAPVLRLAGVDHDIEIGVDALTDLVAARLLPRFRWLLDRRASRG